MDGSSEARLLARLATGDRSAFWPLWEAHSGKLLGLCLREMNGDRADAEDALGEAMMHALEKLPLHAPRVVHLRQWLMRLTANVCTDLHRRRSRHRRMAADVELFFSGPAPFANVHPPECDVASLIARLPVRLRDAFTLRVLQKLSYAEVAARLELTPANARKRVQQAREALRAMRDDSDGAMVNFEIHKDTDARLCSDAGGRSRQQRTSEEKEGTRS